MTNYIEQGISSLSKVFGTKDTKLKFVKFNRLFSHHVLHRGKKFAIERHKALYLYSARYVQKQKPSKIKRVKSTKSGFPREILFLKDLLDGNYIEKRIGLSILNTYRDKFLDKPNHDLSKITSSGPVSTDSDIFSKFKEFIDGPIQSSFLNNINLDIKQIWHCTTKKGPNGAQQSLFCHADAGALQHSPRLLNSVKKLSTMIHGNESMTFVETLNFMVNIYNDRHKENWKPTHSRIVNLLEGGGKTRTVAMGDFWSQTVLKPIHDCVMKKLKTIPSDATYNQESGSWTVMNRTRKHGTFCYDLESATERFPALIQKLVVTKILGKDIADEWYTLMVDRNFTTPLGDEVKFLCGQPMGLYSSWAIFSLSHHLVVQMSASMAGFNQPYYRYRLLGDDICIFDESVAKCYESVLTSMGVNVSETKSIIPKEGCPPAGEFCKRIFMDGEEYTPITPDILKAVGRDESLFPMLSRYLNQFGWLERTRVAMDSPRYTHYHFLTLRTFINDFYKTPKKRNKVRKLTFYPGYINNVVDNVPFPPWDFSHKDLVLMIHKECKLNMLDSQLQRLSSEEIRIDINAGAYRDTWGITSLEEFAHPDWGPLHPLFVYFQQANNQIQNLQEDVQYDGKESLEGINFLPDPLIRDYRDKKIKREKLNSRLVLEVYRSLNSVQV